jgi:2-succinyl-5-enolpyruvyl-6-hydroxy-3-cyclohexene-1-carboxylate synthase
MKQFSAKRSIQVLGHVLEQYGINKMVISPGSRNAPLAIHFSELDAFECFSIIDERSAAFVATGMAKSLKKPVAISCTSGSAATNYYPAIVEAFYQNIPLLVLTADRPTDYIDIFDGQTIRQKDLFQQHSYGDFQLLEDEKENAEEENFKIIKTAIELCLEKQGPVHINIPLSEPLYQLVEELPVFPSIEIIKKEKPYEISSGLVSDFNLAKRILILTGTLDKNPQLHSVLSQFVKNHSVVVLTEANSNLYHEKFFNHIDRYIFNFTEEDYKAYAPDLLITIGQNVVSKKVKDFLRKAKPANHWHIDEYWQPDTYFALTQKIETKAEIFFSQLLKSAKLEPSAYFNLWDILRDKKDAKHEEYCSSIEFSDLKVFEILQQKIPQNYSVHVSNSSTIRYAELFPYSKEHTIYCNRGTSGIDGCTSTAMGFAMMNPNPTVLISGEIGFLYDINGLWNNYIPPYTRIIVINNGEGNIFRIIPGPSTTNAVDEFISTMHNKNCEHIAKHFGFSYFKVEDEESLLRTLDNFFKPETKPKLLEIDTKDLQNADVLKNYYRFLK